MVVLITLGLLIGTGIMVINSKRNYGRKRNGGCIDRCGKMIKSGIMVVNSYRNNDRKCNNGCVNYMNCDRKRNYSSN